MAETQGMNYSHDLDSLQEGELRDLEHERRDELDEVLREWESRTRRERAREHYGRERDPVEALPQKRDREWAMREQQQKQRVQEWETREEEGRKEREARRGVSLSQETGREVKDSGWSSSLLNQLPERCEQGDGREPVKEEKLEERDLLSDLHDINDLERKSSPAESSAESGCDSEEEEGNSSEEEENTGSNSEELSEQFSDGMSEEEEEGDQSLVVRESRFDPHLREIEEVLHRELHKNESDRKLQFNDRIKGDYVPDNPASPMEMKREPPQYFPAFQGCRSLDEFLDLNRINEGTYGVVYRAKEKKTHEIVALKKLKMKNKKEGFPMNFVREINLMQKVQHPNIVAIREIVVGSNLDEIIVMNYVEQDLRKFMNTMKQPFLPEEVKTLMIQLIRGVKYLHDNWILHRDLKPSNLLLSNSGILKIGDLGLARVYGDLRKAYTPLVVSLWYRAPELLLGAKEYSTEIDMWSVGCIFGELLSKVPLFQGKSEIGQINKIFKKLGTPTEEIWPGYNDLPVVKNVTFEHHPYNKLRTRFGALLSDQGFKLMNELLIYDPRMRIKAQRSLARYFRESPLPIDPSMFPTWRAKIE
ncbi:LOW QUALITY PROTEIN: cyclin-dependent kinase 11B-like [Sarcophilus harrisii]